MRHDCDMLIEKRMLSNTICSVGHSIAMPSQRKAHKTALPPIDDSFVYMFLQRGKIAEKEREGETRERVAQVYLQVPSTLPPSADLPQLNYHFIWQ